MTEVYQDLQFGSLETEKKQLDRTLDPGQYDLAFSKWTYRESRASAKPGINFEFKVINSEDADANGFTVFHWCSWGTWFFNQAILAIFADRLSELNNLDPDSDEYEQKKLNLSFMDIQENISEDLDEAIGNECVAKIKSEDWSNETTGTSGTSIKIERFVV
tara:strand:- start:2170 stop:2652 length:483 start_codon:yes stop_codon:yes gene_type:complete